MLKVNIDGQDLEVPKGTLLIEACRKAGIEVPVYCYHPKMNPVGACRVCVVEVVGGRPKPIQTACTTECMDQMVVRTRSEVANKARAGILEFLLVNHPLDCPVCDRGGECDLQDFTLRYGPPQSRFVESKRHFDKALRVGKNVVLDRERCIMCQRCARFCGEVAQEEGLVIIERGAKSEIGTFEGRSYDSNFSGNVIELCPVGALTAESYRFKARPWELQHFAGVCTQCSLGCNLTLDVRFDRLARQRSRVNDAIDDGWLCDRGRYGFEWVHSENRALAPMIRKDGKLVETTWEEALKAAAHGLREAAPGNVGAVAGPELTNEGAWLLVRLVRAALDSPNLQGAPPRAPRTARVSGLDSAEVIVIADCDPTELTPVLDLRIKKALRRGTKLIVVGACALESFADVKVGSADDLLQEGKAEEPPAIAFPEPRPWEPGGKTSTDAEVARKLLAGKTLVTVIATSEPSAGAVDLAGRYQAPHGLLQLVEGVNASGLRALGVWAQPPDFDASPAWGPCSQETGKPGPYKATLFLHAKPAAGEHVVVVTHTLTPEVREHAHVVLPACAIPEQLCTLISTDGTLQMSRQALAPPGQARPDWRILSELAAEMGQLWGYRDPGGVFFELGRYHPDYQGATYEGFMAADGVHWSYPQQGRLGTPRPDLSAIPVRHADAPPWIPAPSTGSRAEDAARIAHGDATVPRVPGQEDPRRVAAAMSLQGVLQTWAVSEPGSTVVSEASLVASIRGPQPPGPSPAHRYHSLGVGAKARPQDAQMPPEEARPE
jgi:NADH-quinone oxidoreductase subunit G